MIKKKAQDIGMKGLLAFVSRLNFLERLQPTKGS